MTMSAMDDHYQIGGKELEIPRSELWILSYYRGWRGASRTTLCAC
jgi:hypothetical protein